MRHEAGRGIDVEGVDFLRAVVRDGFDIHPAFGRDDERNAAGDAIDKQGEVEFVRDIDAVGDVETVDLLARVAGRSEEHTSELQSLMRISYAVFCLKKKNKQVQYTLTMTKY